jgi:hypothetical protein
MTRVDDRHVTDRIGEFLIRGIVNTKALVSRLMRPGSVVAFVLVTVTGAAAALKEAGLPNDGYWRAHGPATYALGVLAALSYIAYCFVVLGFGRILRHSDQNARLYAACRDVATLVESATSLARNDIGVHVWTIRGVKGLRRLERRATFVPVERTQTSITWRKGMGVLGQCWVRDEWILADLERSANATTEREFYAIPRNDRFLFSWQEAKATRHYKAVLTWPLHGGPQNARRVVGVLSVDAQATGAVAALDSAWTTRRGDFDAHLAVCEAILR